MVREDAAAAADDGRAARDPVRGEGEVLVGRQVAVGARARVRRDEAVRVGADVSARRREGLQDGDRRGRRLGRASPRSPVRIPRPPPPSPPPNPPLASLPPRRPCSGAGALPTLPRRTSPPYRLPSSAKKTLGRTGREPCAAERATRRAIEARRLSTRRKTPARSRFRPSAGRFRAFSSIRRAGKRTTRRSPSIAVPPRRASASKPRTRRPALEPRRTPPPPPRRAPRVGR